jgi:curli production assembly/transport component CsgF
LNGTFLLNQASEQNTFKAPVIPQKSTPQKTQIERFKDSLQSAILNQVSHGTTQNLFDDNGNILLGSNLNFDLNGDGQSDFSVLVSDAPVDGNVSISISDGITDTVLTVPYQPITTTP